MDIRTNYEAGKTAKDYYHDYILQIPWDLWRLMGKAANAKHKPIASIVRGYVLRGLENDGYDVSQFITY